MKQASKFSYRYIVTVLLCAMVMLGGSGCIKNPSALAVKYMENKYGEKFESIRSTGSHLTPANQRRELVSCESLPGKNILVVITSEGGVDTYADNYMEYYFESQTADYLDQIACVYFDDATIRVQLSGIPKPDNVTLSTTFNDYITSSDHVLWAHLTVVSCDESDVRAFANALRLEGIHFWIRIKSLSETEGYLITYLNGDDDINIERYYTG